MFRHDSLLPGFRRLPPAGSDRPFYIPCFFCTRPSVRSRTAGPDSANRRPPKTHFVHIMFLYGCQAFFGGVAVRVPAWGFPLRKGKRRAAAPCFAFSGFRRGTRFSGGSAGSKAAMGVIRSAARTAFRRCAAGAAPTPPGARKARRPPLPKKGRNSAAASGQALLDAPSAGSYVPPLRTGAEAGPTHRPFVALGAHSSAGRATDF